jgi:murein DD-endopeptidase MepM/ murein hydrolase activator NlpD
MKKLIAFYLLFICLGGSAHAVELSGQISQGALVFGQTKPSAKVYLDEEEILVTEDGKFIFGFGRDHETPAELLILHTDGEKEQVTINVKKRDYEVQRIDGLESKMVSPPESVWQRIAEDRELVSKARKKTDKKTPHFESGFIWPAKGPISGVYGSQRILNGVPKQPHYGVDIANDEGTPVLAPANGIITLAERDLYYTGGTIIIDHGYGLSSTLMHLSSVDVKPGAFVEKGELIGAIGSTGRATGPHLDWRMNWFGRRIDPQTIMNIGGG